MGFMTALRELFGRGPQPDRAGRRQHRRMRSATVHRNLARMDAHSRTDAIGMFADHPPERFQGRR